MRRAALLIALCAAACSDTTVTLEYVLDELQPADVARVQTLIVVDPDDPLGRMFDAASGKSAIAPGVSAQVRDDAGKTSVVIVHDASFGYVFESRFTLRLLAPSEAQRAPLLVDALAFDASGARLGKDHPAQVTFGGPSRVEVHLGSPCPDEQLICGDTCVVESTMSCGVCGHACRAGETCEGGQCRCAGGSRCTGATTCCDEGCVDTTSDAFNCGGCGIACNAGERCQDGHCACGSGARCDEGVTCCGDGGGCAAAGSVCTCGGKACAAGETCCGPGGTACANLATDRENCGRCGNACAAGLACVNGQCACGATKCETTCCDGTACADTTSDCGACGVSCSERSTCEGGKCVCGAATCGANQLCCDTPARCVANNVNHCGTCDKSCTLNERCVDGTCTCNGGRSCAPSETCCADGCFDTRTSTVHCGACDGPACPPGSACVNQACVATTCNPPCAMGNVCDNGTCKCNGAPGCAPPLTCCYDGCFDLQTSPVHCGACGSVGNPTACTDATKPLCIGGDCKSCNTNSDCTPSFSVCGPNHNCVACSNDIQCQQTGWGVRCNAKVCTCMANDDCKLPVAPYCNTLIGRCVCGVDNVRCPPGKTCSDAGPSGKCLDSP